MTAAALKAKKLLPSSHGLDRKILPPSFYPAVEASGAALWLRAAFAFAFLALAAIIPSSVLAQNSGSAAPPEAAAEASWPSPGKAKGIFNETALRLKLQTEKGPLIDKNLEPVFDFKIPKEILIVLGSALGLLLIALIVRRLLKAKKAAEKSN